MNIYDIAKEAGVSASSVSRYFNHPEKLSPERWQAIDAVMQRRSFVPSRVARSLAMSSMKSVGILMNDMQHQRFAIICSSLERAFFQMGYNTMFCNTSNSLEKTQQYLEMLSAARTEALILIGSRLVRDDIKELLIKYFPTKPIVTMDLSVDLPNCHSVMVDHTYGIELAVNHLVARGHEHLAFVACTESQNTARKAESFRNALSIRGLPMNSDGNVVQIPLDACEEPSLNIAEILQASSPKYSGIIFSHEMMAARAIASFQAHGYSVPKDYAVIGYDNLPFALCCQPTLTSIDTQIGFTSRVIANLIGDLLDGNAATDKVIINPKLIQRFST